MLLTALCALQPACTDGSTLQMLMDVWEWYTTAPGIRVAAEDNAHVTAAERFMTVQQWLDCLADCRILTCTNAYHIQPKMVYCEPVPVSCACQC